MRRPDGAPEQRQDEDARPAEHDFAAALPLDGFQGIDAITITAEHGVPGVEQPPPSVLAHGSIQRTVARVALPAVASTLLMTLFTSVDSFWIGTRVGSAGLAAVTDSLFWVWLIIAFAEMISVGLTAVAARRHGERRAAEAARTAGATLIATLALAVVVAVAGLLLLGRMFALMDTPADVQALGTRYLGTYLVGAPLIFGFFAVDATFRASGDTRTPFRLLAASVGLTLVLDPVLILGLGPAPRLGIAGAAVATVATRAVAFVLGVAILRRRRMLRFDGPLRAVGTVFRVGLPTAVTGVMFSLIYVFVARVAAPFGTPALAALGIGHRVESWLYTIGVGFGAAAAAIVGQNLGARSVERAEHAGWIATFYASLPGLLALVLELAIPERLAGIFTNDPAVIAEGAHYLRIAAVSQLFICAEIVLEGALGGAGAAVFPMVTSTAITASRVPFSAWLAPLWGTAGIWWTISLTAVGRAVAMMGLWRSGVWKRKSL